MRSLKKLMNCNIYIKQMKIIIKMKKLLLGKKVKSKTKNKIK